MRPAHSADQEQVAPSLSRVKLIIDNKWHPSHQDKPWRESYFDEVRTTWTFFLLSQEIPSFNKRLPDDVLRSLQQGHRPGARWKPEQAERAKAASTLTMSF